MPNFPRLLYYLVCAMKRLHWDPDKLRKYQEKRLRSIVKYAYDFVPFYHQRFKRAGVNPSSIKTVADLDKLPMTRKDELRREKSCRLISTEFRTNRLRKVRTSGSTGQPFQFCLSGAEDDWRKAIYMRANISCGQKARDRWIVITDPRHFWETTRIQRKLGIYAQTCVSLFSDIQKQVRLVCKAKPDVLDGYSSSLVLLAKEIDQRGLKLIRPRIVFGTAELVSTASSQYIERVLEAPYYDQFGCAELDRIAWVCPEKVGYHMDMDSVITRFVDREGKEISAGERGEIVCTSLFNYAMPFIRYAIGDMGIPSDEECRCGRTLPLMKLIEGRKDSFLLLPDGRVLSPRTFTVALSMFRLYKYIDKFRIIQKKVDHFEIYIEMKDKTVNERTVKTELVTHLKKMLNIEKYEIILETKFTEEIPFNKSGKLNMVISELKPKNTCR